MFRDELLSDKDPDSCYYLYEKTGMLYGLYSEGCWQFGVKVRKKFALHVLIDLSGCFRTKWYPARIAVQARADCHPYCG